MIPLTFNPIESPATAKQDRIELAIENCVLYGGADDVAQFLEYLGPPPRDNRDILSAWGPFFVRPTRTEPPFDIQRIRSRVLRLGTGNVRRPLIEGHLSFGTAHQTRRSGVWPITITLSLNPTRFVRHQQMPTGRDRLASNPIPLMSTRLFSSAIRSQAFGESALATGMDNWIPDVRSWDIFTASNRWPFLFRNCITTIIEALITDIRRAAGQVDSIRLDSSYRLNLRSVETYWEFRVDDPQGAVLALEPMLASYSANQMQTRDYPCEENDGNARCLKMTTRSGEIVKLYPKTNRRVRIEVIHRLVNGEFRLPRGHTFNNIDDLLSLTDYLANISHSRVNSLFEHFRLSSTVPEEQSTLLQFIVAFHDACQNVETTNNLLHLLTHSASIVVGPGIATAQAYRPSLRRLVDRGILRETNNRYVVCERYREAHRLLGQINAGFLLEQRES